MLFIDLDASNCTEVDHSVLTIASPPKEITSLPFSQLLYSQASQTVSSTQK